METSQATQSSFYSILNKEPMQEPTPTPAFDLNALLTAALAQAIEKATAPLLARIALLEDKLDNITTASDERIQEIADDAARMVLSEHTEEYDHDGYDRLEDKLDDKVNEAIDDLDMEDKLRDTLRNMTFSITARY